MAGNKLVERLRNLTPIEIFTGVLCLVAFFQYYAFVESERAFVFPDNLEFAEPLATEKTQKILLNLDITNSGKSAATISELVALVAHNLPERPGYGEQGPNRIRIAFAPVPGNGRIRQQLEFSEWGQETMLAVKSGRMGFYMWGTLSYKDEYNGFIFRSQRSYFCFAYYANTDPNKSVFRTCPNPDFTSTN